MRALVTGAGKGIGRAVAKRLARDYRTLVLMDIDADAVRSTAAELKDQTQVEVVVGSVGRSQDCQRAADAADALGGLDALSHNAGIQTYGTVETTSEDLWAQTLAVNLTGAFLISKATMPMLRAAKGAVVHMASVQGLASQAGVESPIPPPSMGSLGSCARWRSMRRPMVYGSMASRPARSTRRCCAPR